MTLSPERAILRHLAAGPTDSAAEIRDTRKLLSWGRANLGRNAFIAEGLVSTIESSDGLA